MTFRANGKRRQQPQINGYIGYMGYRYDSCVTLAHNNRGECGGRRAGRRLEIRAQMQILAGPTATTPSAKRQLRLQLQFDINGLLPGRLDSSI